MPVGNRLPTCPFSHLHTCIMIENPSTSLAHKSISIGPQAFKFGIETHCFVL